MAVTPRATWLFPVLLAGCTREQMETSWFWIFVGMLVVVGVVDLATNGWKGRR